MKEIKLKFFFELKSQSKPNESNITSLDISNMEPRSTWELIKIHRTINTFIEALNSDEDELVKLK